MKAGALAGGDQSPVVHSGHADVVDLSIIGAA